jgi:2-iminobutanoate/2-iminopropanoate deaminase
MNRKKLTPQDMTPPMGAYSHGYEIDLGTARWIFVTGQIPIDHEGNLVSDDIDVQTRFVFERIKAILEEGSSSMLDVVKAQIFLTDIDDFQRVSAIRNEYFGESRPTSTLVQVSALVREGAKVEVEVIAISEPN